MKNKQTLLVALFLLILLGIGGFILIFILPPYLETSNKISPPKDTFYSLKNIPTQAPSVKILPSTSFKGPVVKYENGFFYPSKLTLDNNEAGGWCLLSVFNGGQSDLIIRLNPHKEVGDTGFAYEPVLPGKSLVIDPRYNIPDVVFHNHKKPGAQFFVHLNPPCLP